MAVQTIPWVVLWTAQRDAILRDWDWAWTPGGIVDRRGGAHQAWGFHWKFYDSKLNGVGRPIFSELDTQRQVAAMRGPRCQVCGNKLPKTNTPWLLTAVDVGNAVHRGGTFVTPTAPTCEDCWPVAEKLCPHLVQFPPRRVHVPSYRVWGAAGKHFRGPADRDGQVGHFQMGCDQAPWVLAAQMLVELEGVQL
jgi:hypothetical protein